MNLVEIFKQFPTQKECIDYLENLKWKGEPTCPYCKSKKHHSYPSEFRHYCHNCKTSYRVTIGTIFHDTRLPLQKWFLAICLILNAKKGISSRQLARDLDVNKDTAWSMQMRVRKAMVETPNSPFSGEIAIEWDSNQEILLTKIASDLRAIRSNNISTSNLDYDILQEYKKLAKFSFRKNDRYETTISFSDDETIIFDEDFSKNIDNFLKGNDDCFSSYEGELEQINLHNGINCFYIYPYGLPEKIRCNFSQELSDNAIDGIGRKVCISGQAIYTNNQNFPHLINVKQIEVYPLENDLPDWNDLLGIAPNATGDLYSEQFIANLRDDWH